MACKFKILILMFLFFGCVQLGEDTLVTVTHEVEKQPRAVEYKAYCRHEAIFCALIVRENMEQEPVIIVGKAETGWHSECYVSGKWIRMTQFGIYFEDEPRLPMTDIREYSLEQFIKIFITL